MGGNHDGGRHHPLLPHQEKAGALLREGKPSPPARAGGRQGYWQDGVSAPTGPPAALRLQPTQARSLSDIENTLARMQVQYTAMAIGQPTVQPARAIGAAEDHGGHRSSPPQPVPVV